MRIERSKYTSPPSPVEAFRRVSSKITRKTVKPNNDDSNHRLLDHSLWDQSDDQHEDDVLPFNTTGKFVIRKTTPMSPLGSMKSPRSMKKALLSKINTAVEHNSYFGHHESRDDDESNVGLLSRDGQYENRYASWSAASDEKEEDSIVQTQTNSATNTKPLLPDLVDLGGFSDSAESTGSSKENVDDTPTPDNEQERDGASISNIESLAYSVETEEEDKAQELQEKVTDDEVVAVEKLNQSNELDISIELEGSSSTVDFDEDLSLAKDPLSITQDPPSVEEESEKKSIASSPTDITSYASHTRQECPVVVSSSEHGDVILLSPKGFENMISAVSTSPVPSVEKEDESQDLSTSEPNASVDKPVISGQDIAVEVKKEKNTDSDDEGDDFVISDDWSENDSVGDSSDPFGQCLVNESAIQKINKTDKVTIEEDLIVAHDNESSSGVSAATPVSATSYQLADLETNQLTAKSSSSVDLASFNQIWEGSTKMSEESGSDSEECDENKISDSKKNDDDAWDNSRELISLKGDLSTSTSSEDKSDSSKSEDRDSFISLNNYWSSEWNDLTVDDSKKKLAMDIQDSLNDEADEDNEDRDKYALPMDGEEDSDEFYGHRIVEGSGEYSYGSYGLETISEEGEFEEDEPVIPPSCDESQKEEESQGEPEIDIVKECTDDVISVEKVISSSANPSSVAKREVIVVETVNEFSSDDEETVNEFSSDDDEEEEVNAEKDIAQSTALNGAAEEQNEVLRDLWSKIDAYQSNESDIVAIEKPRQQAMGSTKSIIPIKKHAIVKHSIRDSMRSSFPRIKKAGSTDTTFDNLSNFLDGAAHVNTSLDSLETGSNNTEVLLEDENVKIDSDTKRTSVKRHVFTKLIAPVSALVNKRRTSSDASTMRSSNQEDAGNESSSESDDDHEARELAELLSTAMMAREQEKMNKAAAFAKQLAEIREAMAMEQELAEIEGCHDYEMTNSYGLAASVENYSSSDEDDSQIEILNEELVTPAAPAAADSNEVEAKDLHDLWSKIDEYQASGKSLDKTQLAVMADALNSQIEEYQVDEVVANDKVTDAEDKTSAPESTNNDPPEESSSAHLDLEQQNTYESADSEDHTQLCPVPSATSINSFASIISADKSSESLDDVSKAGSDISKGSLVSKLYSDNADLAETLAATQSQLEKALKELEKLKMEKNELIASKVHSGPVTLPKSSFDDYFERDELEEENNDNGWNEADLECNSGLCEI